MKKLTVEDMIKPYDILACNCDADVKAFEKFFDIKKDERVIDIHLFEKYVGKDGEIKIHIKDFFDFMDRNSQPIIRCKDCCFYMCGICLYFSAELEDQTIRVQENDFCSYGEKKHD